MSAEKNLKFVVGYSKTVNLGKFESARYSLSAEFIVGEKDPNEAFQNIKTQVHSWIEGKTPLGVPSTRGGKEASAVEEETLEKISWQQGPFGDWCFADQVPKLLVEQLERGSKIIGSYRYRLSKGKDRLFVNRAKTGGS